MELKHYGVKGMKWGVRKKVSNASSAVKTRLKEEVQSKKRELGWRKELNNINEKSLSELKKTHERVLNENRLKSLSKEQKVRTMADLSQKRSDKKTYRNREKLSDSDLKQKVEELHFKDLIRKQISQTTSGHRDAGKQALDNLGKRNSELGTYTEYGKIMLDYALGAY